MQNKKEHKNNSEGSNNPKKVAAKKLIMQNAFNELRHKAMQLR